jgi:galactose-1-phosphate uridylyltransferase
MPKQFDRKKLEKLVQAEHIEALSFEQIQELFIGESEIHMYAPDGICQTDPRNGDRIVFNSARARRPHDNDNETVDLKKKDSEQKCLICEGLTTKILDMADLSEGFTFINKNLFPIFYPETSGYPEGYPNPGHFGEAATGYHFLQWTSSFHDKDWQNMPLNDRVIVLQRLAALEEKLLKQPGQYVSIIKNYGRLVGGSLSHGHQQIGVSNIQPNRILQDQQFVKEHGETFPAYMLRENPKELWIKDYGPAVLLTPYFMRRPYDMQLLLKDVSKSHLFELSDEELKAVANGWRDAIRVMLTIMPKIGKETAYNVTTHNGEGYGIYFEFLPYTQEMGGFEHLGLYLCQGNPLTSAQTAREILSSYGNAED